MRWGEATTLEFVKLYLKHECLWNPEHSGYKMKFEREKAYYTISTDFKSATGKNMSVSEIKVKIKNLRTTYIQQVHKILQKSSPDGIYEPSLVWFHEMDRCLKHIKHMPVNRHSTTYGTKEPVVDSSCQLWVDPVTGKIDDHDPVPLVSQTDDEYLLEQEEIKKGKKTFKKNKKRKLKKKSPVCYLPDSNSSPSNAEDEFDIYGKYIASQLRRMELQRALRLQLEIQSLVSEARISDM